MTLKPVILVLFLLHALICGVLALRSDDKHAFAGWALATCNATLLAFTVLLWK